MGGSSEPSACPLYLNYAGSGTITAEGAGVYAAAIGGGTVTGTYSGQKITPTVKAPTANRLVYTSQAQELVSAGSTKAGNHTVYYNVIEDTYLVTLTPEISHIGRLTPSYQGDVPPTNAGTYSVVLQAADTDQTYIGRQAIPFEIIKAVPVGEPKYTAITTSGKTLSDAALTVEGGTFSVPGTVTWELDDTTAIEANTAYKWIFTPADTDNYTTLEGNITLWQHSNGNTPPTCSPEVSQPGEGGAVSVTPSRPERGDTVTVKPKPDEGYEVDKITVTDKDGKPVEVTVRPDGTYTFKQPNGKVKIEVSYKAVQPIEAPWNNPFSDVSESDWYYEAVRFVHERDLMNGYSDGRFGPSDVLSRSQLAQILFNKEGRPGVDQLLDFSDVSGEAWYAEAVRWAVESGILNGDGRLGPQGQATRAQAAQMLKNFFEKG